MSAPQFFGTVLQLFKVVLGLPGANGNLDKGSLSRAPHLLALDDVSGQDDLNPGSIVACTDGEAYVVEADRTPYALAKAAAVTAVSAVIGTLASLTTTVKTSIVAALNEVDAHADTAQAAAVAAQATADAALEQLLPMAVFGTWAIDGDDANTNGAGLVGSSPLLTEAAPAQCKIEDGGVFANLADSAGEAGYTGAYQLFPDAPVAETDFAYFGASTQFCELGFNMSATVATFDAAGVLTWEYWDGAAWSPLTIAFDGTSASTADGTLSFGQDGAIAFVPPADWAQSAVDGVTLFWVRSGIAAGKAANLTQVPLTAMVQHQVVSPDGGWVSRLDGTITTLRVSDGAANLHTTADVKFILMNYTSGEHSGELTWAQDQRTQRFTGLSLAMTAGDILGVLVTQEDGAAEPDNVMFELGVTLTA